MNCLPPRFENRTCNSSWCTPWTVTVAAKYNFPQDYFRLDKNSNETILKCGVFEKENAASTKQQLEDQHLQASEMFNPLIPQMKLRRIGEVVKSGEVRRENGPRKWQGGGMAKMKRKEEMLTLRKGPLFRSLAPTM